MRGVRPPVLPVGPRRGSCGPQPARPLRGGSRALEPGPAAGTGRVEGAGLQPGLRAARMAVAAHADRDRHRRHAVHRRLGDDAAREARIRNRPGDPPGDPGQARCRRPHDRGTRSRGERGRHDPRVGRPRRGRARARSRAARTPAPGPRPSPGRRPRRRRRLATDARVRADADRRVRQPAAADHRSRARRREQGIPRLAGRGQLHVPRLPGIRPDRGRGRGHAAGDRRLGSRDPPRYPHEGAEEADRQGARSRAGPADPAADEGELALARPPSRVPRLHWRQEI